MICGVSRSERGGVASAHTSQGLPCPEVASSTDHNTQKQGNILGVKIVFGEAPPFDQEAYAAGDGGRGRGVDAGRVAGQMYTSQGHY